VTRIACDVIVLSAAPFGSQSPSLGNLGRVSLSPTAQDRLGCRRSAKRGTIASPWRYDAGASYAPHRMAGSRPIPCQPLLDPFCWHIFAALMKNQPNHSALVSLEGEPRIDSATAVDLFAFGEDFEAGLSCRLYE
jgi:hypothetical protein